jgi:hypothetical protein
MIRRFFPECSGVKLRISSALWLVALAATPLSAHHSAAAEYESKLVTISGTVLQYQWRNPHVFIYLDIKDANGADVKLYCEGNGPGALALYGWGKDTLQPGDKITLEGYRAKYRVDGFKVHTVTLPGGTRLLME